MICNNKIINKKAKLPIDIKLESEELDRLYIGYEIDKKYFDVMKTRLV